MLHLGDAGSFLGEKLELDLWIKSSHHRFDILREANDAWYLTSNDLRLLSWRLTISYLVFFFFFLIMLQGMDSRSDGLCWTKQLKIVCWMILLFFRIAEKNL